jgi:dipeptidyl aminopeptidase/acylaminoacyl peptidase
MRTLEADDLFEFKLAGDVQISPSGNLAVYVESQADKASNGYHTRIMRIWPGEEPAPFTQGPEDQSPQFSPDGSQLGFLSKRSGQLQIWIMSTSGGEASQLSRIEGGTDSFIWAPDSRTIYAVAQLDDSGIGPEKDPAADGDDYHKFTKDVKIITELAHKMDGVGYFGTRRPHIVRINLDGSEPVQLTRGPSRHSQIAISPDGSVLLFTSRYGEDYDRESFEQHAYAMHNPGHAPTDPVRVSPPGLSAQSATFHPDGEHIMFTASNTDDLGYDNPQLYYVTLANLTEAMPAAPGWDRPIGNESLSDMIGHGSNPLRFAQQGQLILTLTSVDGTVQLAAVDWQKGSVDLLTAGEHAYYSYDATRDGKFALLAKSTPSNPTQIEWLDIEHQRVSVLADPNQALLSQLHLAVPERFQFHAPDGPSEDGWAMPPAGAKPGERYPTVLEIHGGPMAMYAQSFFLEFQWLAAHGYGIVYTNPRGSQGYGRDFCMAIQNEWGRLDYDDIMAGLDAAIVQNDWIDKDRLAVAGGSYGGYMTNWIVGHSHRFRAAITMRSVVDWKAMVGTGDGGWHWMRRAHGVAPWQPDDAWYRQQSPMTYVENITTPLLIEHQEGDLRCPIEQGEMLYTAVKYLNRAPVKFIRYPGEFHGMSRNGKPWHRVFRLNSFTEWLEQYL